MHYLDLDVGAGAHAELAAPQDREDLSLCTNTTYVELTGLLPPRERGNNLTDVDPAGAGLTAPQDWHWRRNICFRSLSRSEMRSGSGTL